MTEIYDHIVGGGESAGCVVANRLVLAGRRALLLEAGPADNDKFVHMPATFVRVLATDPAWTYETVVESGGFVDTLGAGRPDLQFHVLPALAGDVDRQPLPGHGISINPCFLRPKSRGGVALQGPDPLQPIRFDGGYLNEHEDVDTLIRGVRLAHRILRAPALRRLITEELLPSAAEEIDVAAIEDHVRRQAKTVYHPAGTCRMGRGDDAVVAPALRVHGVGRLRVADASVMPTIVSGNTNVPAIMIGERCADFMLAG